MSQNRIRLCFSSNSNGQMVVETVLIMVLCLGLLMASSRILKDGNVIKKLINGPWARAAIMIETGTWSASLAEGRTKHPNAGLRSRILRPE